MGRSLLGFFVATVFYGCGGSTPLVRPMAASADPDPARPGPSWSDPLETGAPEAVGSAEGRLDPRASLPGTGVSMRAPGGSERTAISAGFIDPRGRFQIFVAVASGDDALLDDFARGLGTEALAHELGAEAVTIDGRATRLVLDTEEQGYEREWIFLRDGDHALAVVGAYDSTPDQHLRELVRESLLSIRWDARATIEPERAAGFGLTPPAQLTAEPRVVAGLTYLEPGLPMSPGSGRPAIFLFPIPVDVPPSERAEYCEPLLLMAGPIGEQAVVSHAAFSTEALSGCEVFGHEEILEPIQGGPTALATYAAIVFLEDGAFMVAGFVDANERETWAPLFTVAARTVTRVAR
jgi:hypothetical protein